MSKKAVMNTNCLICQSPKPNLHPAMQFEGEVSPCSDGFHRLVTPENTLKKIAEVEALAFVRPSPSGT